MAITVETRTKIIELVVGMVDAAPGATILSELANIADAGLSIKDMAIAIAANPAFNALYPSFLTTEELANNFITNLLGTEVTAEVKASSVAAMVADLNAGTDRGEAMYKAITALSATAETDTDLGAAAAALNNKTEVAIHYSVTTQQSADTLDELVAVVTNVTSSEATVTSAKSTIDGTNNAGVTKTFTTAIDNLVGTGGNDTFVGDATTLTASDSVTAGLGTDTLNYTDASTGGVGINANISGIEIVNIRNINGTAGTAAVNETQTLTVAGTATGAVSFYGVAVATSAAADTAAQTATKIAADAALYAGGTTLGNLGVTGITANGAVVTLTFGGFPGTDVAAAATSAVSNGITFGAPAEAVKGAAAVTGGGINDTVSASSFTGATNFNSTSSTSPVTFTGLAAGQAVSMKGDGATTTGNLTATFGTGVAREVSIDGGTRGGVLTITGGAGTATLNSINGVGTTGNSLTSLTVPTTVTALVVNAASRLDLGTGITGMTTGTTATITASGAGTEVDLGSGALPTSVATIDGSGLTAGGIEATMSNGAATFVGGQGTDTVTSAGAAFLTSGSISAGAGADTLILTSDVAALTQGNKYSGFETVRVPAASTQDMDLIATNNAIASIQTLGTATLTNVTPASAGAVVSLAGGALSLGIKGALTPGQIDTVGLIVTNASSSVATHTYTNLAIAGVEVLNITNSENTTINTLANALALTNINVTGGSTAPVSITTTAIALQTNFAVNASGLAGNFVFNGTGATTNGFSVTGGSGTNTITGGSQIFSANLSASTSKMDTIAVTNATGGTLSLANAKVTGFTSSADTTVGDQIDTIGAATIQADVAAGTATGIANLTAAVNTGIMTFAGTAAATATLANKLTAAASANFANTANETVAFVHGGDTYIFSQQATDAAYNAGADVVVQLIGVTDLTALSTTASAANTAWVV